MIAVQLHRAQQRYEALEAQEREIVEHAPEYFREETKAVATAFLILDPDGRVHREPRIPRQSSRSRSANGNGHAGSDGTVEQPKPPTSDDLGDSQLATTFTHQAIGVREALLKNTAIRKRVLALILHEKVRSDALAIRHEANGTTLLATKGETFASAVFDRLKEKRAKLDPFADKPFVNDCQAYQHLEEISDAKVDALIDLLVVECITTQMQKCTELVQHLADELKVNIRDFWRPDAAWLSSFQKIQLAHLIAELRGPEHTPAPERKKSELVEELARLFTGAVEDKLQDKKLAERVNRWLPSNLREDAATRGARVILVSGPVSIAEPRNVEVIHIQTAAQRTPYGEVYWHERDKFCKHVMYSQYRSHVIVFWLEWTGQ